MAFESSDKLLIFDKIKFQKLFQPGIRYFADIRGQSGIHFFYIFICCRHIVSRLILSLFCSPDLFDIELEIAVIADHIAVDFNKILLVIIRDPLRVRVPDLTVQGSRLILQDQIIIWFTVPCLRGTLSPAEIDIPYCLAFM